MNPYYTDDSVTVFHGDCLDVLRELPDDSVDSVVTDPPYGLGFMGREWDDLPRPQGYPHLVDLLRYITYDALNWEASDMDPAQAARVVETAATIWPNVKDVTLTREAWFLALSKTDFYDAMDALGALAGEKKSIHVSDVVKRAARIRALLLRGLPPLPPPPVELADDFEAEALWLRVARDRQLAAARMERHSVPA